MKKKLFFLVPIGLAFAAYAAYKFVYKKHRDIASEESSFTISTAELKNAFVENDSAATRKYADRTVEVSGVVTSIDDASNTLVLDEKLSATMSGKIPSATLQKKVTIKGRVVGYDDLLEELKMDHASILN